MSMMLRRHMMIPKGERWDYVYYPNENGIIIPSSNLYLTAGQTLVIAWSTSHLGEHYTNRYLWRCIGAQLDGGGSYAGVTMSNMTEAHGQQTYSVTGSGNIVIGNYNTQSETTGFMGDWIKVRIN